MKKKYNLRKCRHIMRQAYSWYQKKWKELSTRELDRFEAILKPLDEALLSKNREEASQQAHLAEEFCKKHFKKSFFEHARELVIALSIALALAIVVRQVWFEPMQIPTGSMRPTYQEKDALFVSKNSFGINVPLTAKHLYFDPDLVKRTGAIILLPDNLAIRDTTAWNFGFITYTKRFIKRLMGKPGDTLYFYGGRIYGIDADDNPLPELITVPEQLRIDHIPFLDFYGHYKENSNLMTFRQMNLPVARIHLRGRHPEIHNGTKWIKEDFQAAKKEHQIITTYGDLWGINNFAMARLLTKKELKAQPQLKGLQVKEGLLYLELSHNPTLATPQQGTFINTFKTIIPLNQEHLDRIMDHMYTARFVMEDGKAHVYSAEGRTNSAPPRFKGVEDGTYQIYFGQVEKVNWSGLTSKVDETNPLYQRTPENVQKLFNLGLRFNKILAPSRDNTNHFPHRYAYFRDGDLYLLGGKVMDRDDPTLLAFVEKEQQRQASSNYLGFLDSGAPIKEDGSWDIERIKTFGLVVPKKHYLALGDNHAMSGDSRIMGFIPEDNLRGTPARIVWPTGSRWGIPELSPYSLFIGPRIFIWIIALVIGGGWYLWHRRKITQPIFHSLRK